MHQSPAEHTFHLALQLHQNGDLAAAEKAYRQVLALEPQHVDALHNMAIIANAVGKKDAAEQLLRLVIRIQPSHADAHNNLSNLLREAARYEESIQESLLSLRLNENSPIAHYNLGLTLHLRHRNPEAAEALRKAIALAPDMHQAFSSLATVLSAMGHHAEALLHFQRAVALQPDYCEAHNNLGLALMNAGRWEEALAAMEAAIACDPTDAYCHCNLANAQKDLYLLDQAIASYRTARSFMPDKEEIHSNLLMGLNYDPTLPPETLFHEHRQWQVAHATPLRDFIRPHTTPRDPEKCLRIAFISPDFRHHSVAYFLIAVIENLDRTKFQVVCYSDVQTPDAYTQRFAALADLWRHTAAATPQELADLIASDAIDILIDLTGHTAYNRLTVFARQPAPLQISWLGYPNTTGLDAMQYRFTDAIADPPGETEHLHTETLVRLPISAWCYRPPEPCPPVNELPALENGHVTFASFNAMPKINPALISLWADILHAVPHSRLYLKNKSLGFPQLTERIKAAFHSHGIDPQRIHLAPQVAEVHSHLSHYGRVDISLDTYPYHGTTTTCEALWMGVPVVTMAGKTHLSRVSVSLLSHLGCPTWIAANREEYLAIATRLATDLPTLAHTRATLREKMRHSPLMDEPRFTRDLETTLRHLWQGERSRN